MATAPTGVEAQPVCLDVLYLGERSRGGDNGLEGRQERIIPQAAFAQIPSSHDDRSRAAKSTIDGNQAAVQHTFPAQGQRIQGSTRVAHQAAYTYPDPLSDGDHRRARRRSDAPPRGKGASPRLRETSRRLPLSQLHPSFDTTKAQNQRTSLPLGRLHAMALSRAKPRQCNNDGLPGQSRPFGSVARSRRKASSLLL
jgi:hypothetical protein